MKTSITVIAAVVALSSASAFATSKDCGCTKTPTAYDKSQDVKIGALQDRDAQLAADIHTVHMNTLGKYSESWGLEDRANIGKLQEEKLDKAVFQADQQRQDKALGDAVTAQAGRDAGQDDHINAVQGAAQAANEKADGLAVRADASESAIRDVQGAAQTANDRAGVLEQRADASEGAIRETNAQVAVTDKRSINNAQRLDGVEKVNGQQDKAIASNTQRITTSEGDIKQLYANGEYAQSRIDAANANIEANRSALVSSNKRIAANTQQLANHEQRITGLEQQTNRNFAEMGKRIDKVQDKANAGTATALAAAGIPQVTGEQRFSLGAALGGYESEQAVAVGFSSRLTSNVVLKASVATDSQHGVGYNVGTSIGW